MGEPFYTTIECNGRKVLYRGYDAEGNRVHKRLEFKPSLFAPAKLPNDDDSGWKTMDGRPLKEMKFSDVKEYKDFLSEYRDIEGVELYGNDRKNPAVIQYLFPNEIKYNRRLINTVNFDIETAVGDGFPDIDEADQEIRAITATCTRDNLYRVWGLKPYKAVSSDVIYYQCDTEAELLKEFVGWWSSKEFYPDILTGWNVQLFDVPYLCNRITRVLGEKYTKKLSPWGIVFSLEKILNKHNRSKKVRFYGLRGIQLVDYMDLFKKFAYTYGAQESYSLNNISHVVLGEEKLDYSDIGNLNDLFEKDHQKYIDYNIKDVRLVSALEEKLGLIDIALTVAYMSGVNVNDTLATTPIWDSIIFRSLARQKIAVPVPKSDVYRPEYEGGYVKDPVVGMHNWLASFDLNSLYPNIIVQWNMSPETLVGKRTGNIEATKEKMINGTYVNNTQNAVAANGAQFRTDVRGVIPRLVSEIYDSRVKLKKEMINAQKMKESSTTDEDSDYWSSQIGIFNNQQMAMKILLNSLYGALGNKYFRYFDVNIAEGITTTGQMVIRYAERQMNQYLNKKFGGDKDRVIAIDTDSLYVNVDDVVSHYSPARPLDFIDQYSQKAIEPMLDKSFRKLCEATGGIENHMSMGREVIADRGIWTAKKRYILHVLDNEGVRYKTPKLKTMGLEAVKSSTPRLCRDEMTRLFRVMLTENETTVQRQIADFRKVFREYPVQDIAFPRSVNKVEEYASPKTIYIPRTPINSKASLIYNNMIKTKGLDKRYRFIYSGDKMKYIYLQKANPSGQRVIGFPDDHLPEELGLHPYIDYKTQFEKTFLAPIRLILDAIGWSEEERGDLSALF